MAHGVVYRKRNQFFILENELLQIHSRRMGFVGYGLYSALIMIAGESDNCFPSHDYLAAMFNVTRPTIIKGLQKLQELGYIMVTHWYEDVPKEFVGCEKPEGNYQSNIYWIVPLEEIELTPKERIPLKEIKEQLIQERKQYLKIRQDALIQNGGQQVDLIAQENEIEQGTKPAETQQPSLFDVPKPVTKKLVKPEKPKSEITDEGRKAYQTYREKFNAAPVDGGGNMAWFTELVNQFTLHRVLCAITRARELGFNRTSQLRSILERQKPEELKEFDTEGNHLKSYSFQQAQTVKMDDLSEKIKLVRRQMQIFESKFLKDGPQYKKCEVRLQQLLEEEEQKLRG
jgi:hypothetical protein